MSVPTIRKELYLCRLIRLRKYFALSAEPPFFNADSPWKGHYFCFCQYDRSLAGEKYIIFDLNIPN